MGASIFDLGNRQWDILELRRLLGEVIPKAQAVVGFEVTHDFPSIGHRTMLVSARRLVQPEDATINLFIAFVDVTEARKNAQEIDLLLVESQHRVKNPLAVVHAIAYQTPTQGRTAEEYRADYLSRLNAFLSTEDLIRRCGEEGVTLEALLQDALQSVAPGQISLARGPSVALTRAHVRPLRMIVHELTTNAFKHGALSRPGGAVCVSWERIGDGADASIRLDWREEGGPPASPPDRLGHGKTMIERTAKNNGWDAEVHFHPEGLEVEILMPIGKV